ncbi:hypothetical protein EJK15_21260 [Nonomuraea basaltis]|nr:hypothetical protein EJK15_21260 [Nonomuraea basaltis]
MPRREGHGPRRIGDRACGRAMDHMDGVVSTRTRKANTGMRRDLPASGPRNSTSRRRLSPRLSDYGDAHGAFEHRHYPPTVRQVIAIEPSLSCACRLKAPRLTPPSL